MKHQYERPEGLRATQHLSSHSELSQNSSFDCHPKLTLARESELAKAAIDRDARGVISFRYSTREAANSPRTADSKLLYSSHLTTDPSPLAIDQGVVSWQEKALTKLF